VKRAVALISMLLLGALLLGGPARAADTAIPKQLEGIGIEDHTGATVPKDVKLYDPSGREVTVGSYLRDDKPLLLLLAYYECPMLCSLVINGLLQGMKDTSLSVGADYRVLVVSFDARDTVEIARKKREAYVGAYGRKVEGDGWDFTVGGAAEVKRLADAVGFRYRWDEKTEQFAHAAGAFVLTPDGRISRTLYGISFPSKNLGLALREAAGGKIGGIVDRVLLFCFHYDPLAGSYVLASARLMKAAGLVMVIGLLVLLLRLRRSERVRIARAAGQRS
jgi:protein SCO1/2